MVNPAESGRRDLVHEDRPTKKSPIHLLKGRLEFLCVLEKQVVKLVVAHRDYLQLSDLYF